MDYCKYITVHSFSFPKKHIIYIHFDMNQMPNLLIKGQSYRTGLQCNNISYLIHIFIYYVKFTVHAAFNILTGKRLISLISIFIYYSFKASLDSGF